jgi:hypothetical protein
MDFGGNTGTTKNGYALTKTNESTTKNAVKHRADQQALGVSAGKTT